MTQLLGKDDELEHSLKKMQAQLAALGFDVKPYSWLNPVPNVWSVHVRDSTCPQLFTNGKGKTRDAALASAFGEFFERLATNYFFADFHLGQDFAQRDFVHYPDEQWLPHGDERLLNDEPLTAFYNAEGVLDTASLTEINSAHHARGVCTLPFRRIGDDKEVFIPVNLLENLYASNGMSAGNTPAEARVQCLSEILERSVKFHILREGSCLPDIPEEVINQYPSIAESIQSIRDAGYALLIKDASLNGRHPVINVTLMNPADGSCFASFGAHPLFEVALERTVTELLQGRALDSMKGFSVPSADNEEVASVENLETHFIDSSGLIHWRFFHNEPDYEFVHWDFPGTTEEQYAHLAAGIQEMGYTPYLRDYEDMGFYACRIIVPGLSEIYPPEDLWYANNNAAVDVLDCLWKLPELNEFELKRLAHWLESTQVDDFAPLHELAGHRPAAESYWNHLRLGELRLWAALATGDKQTALDNLSWLQDIDSLPEARLRLFQCMYQILEITASGTLLDGYEAALSALYGQDTLAEAKQCLDGALPFHGITSPTDDSFHQSLVQAYDKAWQQRQASV
jgi:ribosomal protein S12 methylthiotransferase accessory factor